MDIYKQKSHEGFLEVPKHLRYESCKSVVEIEKQKLNER